MKPQPSPCPCGSGRYYSACCEPFHQGASAPTAEALMRSRYSAFALSLETYLLATWHPSTCPATLELDQAPQPQWLKLTVKRYKKIDAHHAMVEFVARYRVEGQVFTLKENSHFVWEAQKWWYVNGEIG